jgi:DNA-binding beta-propeller fold protein YncE
MDLPESGAKPVGVAVDADGTIAVAGSYQVNGAQSRNGRVWMFDEDGVLLLSEDIAGSTPGMDTIAHDVAFTVDGDLLVVGDQGNRYALLSRWNRTGELAWLELVGTVEEKFYHGAVGVAVRDADNAAVVGWWPSEIPANGRTQVWVHGFTP